MTPPLPLRPATLDALDWPAVCEALATHARTRRGAAACLALPLFAHASLAREAYAEVEEVGEAWRRADDVPVGGVADVADPVERAARGAVLEAEDLREIGGTARVLAGLRDWADDRADWLPRLHRIAQDVQVDPDLVEILGYAFDATGALDERTYPELGTLRRRIAQLRDRVRSTLEEIVRGTDWKDALQDSFVSERDGRFVVPVKMAARRGLGIVHGVSGSGETAFVEPTAVVELHNELKETEGELARTERRILTELSREVGRRGPALRASLVAAMALDVAVARAGLGRTWNGSVPTVGGEGVMALKRARHPLLALREAESRRSRQPFDVVGNDLHLSPQRPGLVLTGPNAGGKTVALKTLGLCALLVRGGVPLPVDPGSRCDLFTGIVADVGDQQSVAGGLSTFSAHVGLLREALAAAAPGNLVLLDEVAVGTDPAQGAALARAVLERVVSDGARVVATTHYPELKALAGADPRFVVAAAQYEGGRPTYRLELGAPGASYALAMAGALGLDGEVIDRARTLLDEGQRALADTLERLSAERAALAETRRAVEARAAEAEARLRQLEAEEQKLAREGRKRLEEALATHRARLHAQEESARALVARLQAGGDLGAANKGLQELRAMRTAVTMPTAPAVEAPPYQPQVGESVRVRSLDQVGVVRSLGSRPEVEIGRMRMRVALTDLEPARGKAANAAKALDPDAGAPRVHTTVREAPPTPTNGTALRTSLNSCDVRGQRADEAIASVERFVDAASLCADRTLFVCHGHGTGALKNALRAWLPSFRAVKRWRPADADEGGDAWTVLELR